MAVCDVVREKLQKAFAPTRLVVVDESHLHQGHAGHRPGIETHFRVTIASAAFSGASRVARHRMVTGVLADEIGNPIHALALHTLTPEEDARN